MELLNRKIYSNFVDRIRPNKVLILYGARRVGKTSLINNYLETLPSATFLKLNGEDISFINNMSFFQL